MEKLHPYPSLLPPSVRLQAILLSGLYQLSSEKLSEPDPFSQLLLLYLTLEVKENPKFFYATSQLEYWLLAPFLPIHIIQRAPLSH